MSFIVRHWPLWGCSFLLGANAKNALETNDIHRCFIFAFSAGICAVFVSYFAGRAMSDIR